MPSVVYVAGARPNFMKIAPILRAANGGPFENVLVHTGQHYDHAMSGIFFEQLGIKKPDVHLEVGSAGHGVQTGRVMAAFEDYLVARAELPKGIVVVGDVNSTMACALVGAKLGLPVAHVEAGLRSFDRTMPEEINRIVTDAVSDLLLVSEPSGIENLAKEGIPGERVHYVGNVMIDTLVEQLPASQALDMPARVGVPAGDYAVVTLHRPSNVDQPRRLTTLVALLERIASQVPIVFPVHPRTETQLRALGLFDRLVASAQLKIIAPQGYREFLGLIAAARVVVTDSGGLQEETTYLRVPCITLRTTTERPATITTGSNILVGEDIDATDAMVRDVLANGPRTCGSVEGWDGGAAPRVQRVLEAAWSQKF